MKKMMFLFLLLFLTRALQAVEAFDGKIKSSANSWQATTTNDSWLIRSRESLFPFTNQQQAISNSFSVITNFLGQPQSVYHANGKTIYTYGLARLKFFQFVFDTNGIVDESHSLAYRRLSNGSPEEWIESGVGTMTNDPTYDIGVWQAMIGRDRPDADLREIALNAARFLAPEMPESEVLKAFGPPDASISRKGRSILIYRIGASDFIHITLTDERLMMGAQYRHYRDESGRLFNKIITGHVEKVEAPDLVFGDWQAAAKRHERRFERMGLGKHVALLLKGLSKKQVLELLGTPDRSDTERELYYDFSFSTGMAVSFDQDDNVANVRYVGK